MNIEIANKLVQLRRKNGLSQEALAEKLGISRQAVSKWERAEASPDTDNLIVLAKLYNVSLDELLLQTDEEEPEEKNIKKEETDEKDPNCTASDCSANSETNQNGDEVHIGASGIHVNEEHGDKVDIDNNGVVVNGKSHGKDYFRRWALREFPISIIIVAAYLFIGFIFHVWHPTWILFLLIPMYHNVINMIERHDRLNFGLLATIVFLTISFCVPGAWPWSWLIFLLIPVWHELAKWIKKVKSQR